MTTKLLKSLSKGLSSSEDSSVPINNIELIQQWQALGKLSPELLEDKALERCKKAGLNSLQSYVYWAEIEKQPSEIDFFAYDELVEKLKRHGLKWVPFLILGPYYATPKWFQKTNKSVYAKCLEHGRETKIQSIWNPYLPKYIDRFLRLFSKHYKYSPMIKSIQLGISGSWGEALFPTTGGFSQHRDFHEHPGWWCGDKYAIYDFQSCMEEKYGSIKRLNAAWGKNFRKFEEIDYPEIKPSFVCWYIDSFKALAEFSIKTLVKTSTSWDKSSIGIMRLKYPSPQEIKRHTDKLTRWLDFVQWYLNSMTKWAEFWIKTARKYFPRKKMYLVTGGDNNPILGADFSTQAKVSAKYGAGVRITNQENKYARTFVLTRLAACASRFYGGYFTVEESWHDSPEGTAARIFDAATSGARGIYFKDMIGNNIDASWTRANKLALGKPTPNALAFARNIPYFRGDEPVVEVAALFPNISVAMNPVELSSFYSHASRLRDFIDFDIIDENMSRDSALKKYRFLILLGGPYLRRRTLVKIEEWVKGGGVLVDAGGDPRAVEDGAGSYEDLRILGEAKKVGCGFVMAIRGRDKLGSIKNAVYNVGRRHPWRGVPETDGERDGIYAARFSDKVLYFNSTGAPKIKHVVITNLPKKVEFELEIKPHSINSVDVDFG